MRDKAPPYNVIVVSIDVICKNEGVRSQQIFRSNRLPGESTDRTWQKKTKIRTPKNNNKLVQGSG